MKKTSIFFLALIAGAQSLSLWAAQPLEQRALVAHMKVLPGKEQLFLNHAQTVIESSRREPGNLMYILHQSSSNPQQFVFYELFRTEGDLQFHRNAPHVRGFLKAVDSILVPGQFILEEYVPTNLERLPQAQTSRTRTQSPDGLLRACNSIKDKAEDCLGKIEGDYCGESGPAGGICKVYEDHCYCSGSY